MNSRPLSDNREMELPLSGKTVCLGLYGFDIGGSERLSINLAKYYLMAGAKVFCCGTRLGDGPLSDNLREFGIEYVALDINSKSRIRKYATRIWLAYWIKAKKIDVLHAHHFCVLYDFYFAMKTAGIDRVLVTEHTADNVRNQPDLARIVRHLAPAASRVTAINADVARAISEVSSIDIGDISIVENGVNTEEFCPTIGGSQSKTVRIIWVGRLHPDKDILTAIRAVKNVIEAGWQDILLTIVGAGECAGEARNCVAQLGLEGVVVFRGEIKDVAEEFRKADIMLLSSVHEGTPLAMLEGMASALPIVATNVGGIPEIVSDQNGVLCPVGDSAALAEALIRLLGNSGLRKEMGNNARATVLNRYSESVMAKKYIREILGSGPLDQELRYPNEKPPQ